MSACLCVWVCVCLPVYLCICYLNILFCQRKSFLQPAVLASSRNGEENGEKRRRRRSCVKAKLGGVQAAFQACALCPAHLPHAKSIYIFHCSLAGPCTCVCVCVFSQAWPNRFLLIFWGSQLESGLKGTLTHVATAAALSCCCNILSAAAARKLCENCISRI